MSSNWQVMDFLRLDRLLDLLQLCSKLKATNWKWRPITHTYFSPSLNSTQGVSTGLLQLIATSCLSLATKQEEVSCKP